MADRIIMPKQGLQMTEGTIISWLAAEGEPVTQGQPLFEMETDKLAITIDSPATGTLLKIVAPAGETVPITELIAVVGRPGEDIAALLAEKEAPPAAGETAAPAQKQPPPPSEGSGPGRLLVTPRAKGAAARLGLELSGLAGRGPGGMIVEREVLEARQKAPLATPLAKAEAARRGVALDGVTGSGSFGKITQSDVADAAAKPRAGAIVPMRGMRGTIAQRMKQSLADNAQTTHRVAVRMQEAGRLRAGLEKKVGYNDLIAYATVRALTDFPAVNSQLVEAGIWQKDFVNLGVAVAVEGGLLVPVIKDAHRLSLAELSAAIAAKAEGARAGTLGPDDCAGGSFTLSNLGMYGLEEFVAIINPPEAGILAVGKIEDEPVAENGQVVVRPVMRLTLSYDHRVVDGAPAALFLVRVKDYLENPYRLL